jgi:hypothetical protein
MEILTVVCAWCKKLIKQGNSKDISHGICKECFNVVIKKIEGLK